jgi:hypothetical protein
MSPDKDALQPDYRGIWQLDPLEAATAKPPRCQRAYPHSIYLPECEVLYGQWRISVEHEWALCLELCIHVHHDGRFWGLLLPRSEAFRLHKTVASERIWDKISNITRNANGILKKPYCSGSLTTPDALSLFSSEPSQRVDLASTPQVSHWAIFLAMRRQTWQTYAKLQIRIPCL